MSRGFLVLWSKDRLKQARERGWVGKPLPALYGGPHVSHPSLLRHGVGPGDAVHPVCVSDGRLLVLCRVAVADVLPVDEFVRRQRDGTVAKVPPEAVPWLAPTCTDDAAVVRDSTPLRDDCAVPAEMLAALRLVNPRGEERALKHVADGRVLRTAGLDSHYYRLSDATDEAFARLTGGSGSLPP